MDLISPRGAELGGGGRAGVNRESYSYEDTGPKKEGIFFSSPRFR